MIEISITKIISVQAERDGMLVLGTVGSSRHWEKSKKI
jgi:hypothetical protein